jgi:hypothetical protein
MNPTDDELLSKIKEAVSAENAARTEHVSRAKEVGLLLLEAKKRHPAVEDFEKFIKPVAGLEKSRAYELMKLAGGRTIEEELKKGARERQAKSRAKRKKGRAKNTTLPSTAPTTPASEPDPTFRDVTEKSTDPDPDAAVTTPPAPVADTSSRVFITQTMSAKALAEFKQACRTYWPGITEEAHQQQARDFIDQLTQPRREAA